MRYSAVMLAACLLMPAAAASAAVIGHMTTALPLTDARIAALPKAQQGPWLAYLARSRALMAADKAALAAERRGIEVPPPLTEGRSGGAGMDLKRPAAWYGGPEARRIADNIVSFQTPAGGWGKNQDRTGPPRLKGQHYVIVELLPANAREDIKTADPEWAYVGTIDNNATTSEMRFLARVQAALPGAEGEPYRAAFLKGLRYLLEAQYPNGGWPQVYPLQGGYHDALTYNDDALSDVAGLLADIGARRGDYAFVPASLSSEARAAVARAIDVVLGSQVVVDGRRTVWGQQYDPLRLVPVGARNFEPAALSTTESADLLLFLMRQPQPTPAMCAAIGDGIAWLKAHALHDVEWARDMSDRHLVAKAGAGPIWARYYDLVTGRPIFGDRDKTIHDTVEELSPERRNGYSWYNSGPLKALKAYERWEKAARTH